MVATPPEIAVSRGHFRIKSSVDFRYDHSTKPVDFRYVRWITAVDFRYGNLWTLGTQRDFRYVLRDFRYVLRDFRYANMPSALLLQGLSGGPS